MTQNKKIRIKLPTDPRLWLAIVAFCEKNIIRYIVLVMSMLPALSYLSGFVVPLLYIITIFACIRKVNKISLSGTGVLVFMLGAFIWTWAFFPANTEYIFDENNFWNSIFPCLRWYIVALLFVPTEKNMKILGKVSCVSVFVEILFVVAYMMPNGLLEADDMSRAYQLLPNILLVFNYAFNDKKFLPWLFSALGAVYLLAMGTRGPLIILLVFIFLKFLKNITTRTWKKVLIGIVFVAIGIAFIESDLFIDFLQLIRRYLLQMGFSTRIVDFAIEGNMISYTSGRDDIYSVAFQLIKERPLLGYGIYGEWPVIGWNIHNMYLEILIHYGVILGVVILIWLINLVRKAYFTSKNESAKDMILIFLCFVFVRGFFGGSYLLFGTFFLIGLCIKELGRARSNPFFNGQSMQQREN